MQHDHAITALATGEEPHDVIDTPAEVMRGCLVGHEAQRRFALAGRARVTLVSRTTGVRYTYRIALPREDGDTCRRCEGTGLWQGRRGYTCRSCNGTGQPSAAPSMLFVALLTGSENTADYTYLGQIRLTPHPRYEHGRRSRVSPDAPGAKAVAWWLGRLLTDASLDGLDVWHEGRCGRCGRTLTVPASIETGFGPDCAERMGL